MVLLNYDFRYLNLASKHNFELAIVVVIIIIITTTVIIKVIVIINQYLIIDNYFINYTMYIVIIFNYSIMVHNINYYYYIHR